MADHRYDWIRDYAGDRVRCRVLWLQSADDSL